MREGMSRNVQEAQYLYICIQFVQIFYGVECMFISMSILILRFHYSSSGVLKWWQNIQHSSFDACMAFSKWFDLGIQTDLFRFFSSIMKYMDGCTVGYATAFAGSPAYCVASLPFFCELNFRYFIVFCIFVDL